ncbi:MAG: TlpA family protein disulfide reductase [Pirellula sp.]
MSNLKVQSTFGKLAMLATFGAGCSAKLPPLPEDSSSTGSAAARDAFEPSISNLSVQDLLDNPTLAPHVTWLWDVVRERPGCLGSETLERGLEGALYREFLTPGTTQPSLILRGMVSSLTDAGASREDALNTVDTAIALGLFTFEQLQEALLFMEQLRSESLANKSVDSKTASRRVGSREGEDPSSDGEASGSQQQVDSAAPQLPLGGYCTEWLSSGGDPLNYDCLAFKNVSGPGIKLFMIDGKNFISPLYQFHILRGRQGIDLPPRHISVSGAREIWSPREPGSLISSEEFLVEELVVGKKFRFIVLPITLASVQNRVEETFISRVSFTIREQVEGLPLSSFSGESWAKLDPIQMQRGYTGFKVTALGPNGQELSYPMAAHPRVLGAFGEVIVSKENLQKHSETLREQRQRTNSLIGSQLTKLEMAHTPEAKGATSLDIPQTGRAVVIAGASWCGPCRALDPLVKDYSEHLAAIGSTTKVYKVSIEDNRVQDGTVSDPLFTEEFPSGVLSSQQQKDLSISSVPRFFIVEDGKIVKQGILSAEELRDLMSSEK